MKNAILFFLLISVSAGLFAQGANMQSSSKEKPTNDKAFLMTYIDKTDDVLKKSVAGLSSAQLHYKPAPGRWSISQCLEHIVLTEKALFNFAKSGMDAPAKPERRAEIKMSDEEMISGINDRSYKATATKELTGEGKYTKAEDALKDLSEFRTTEKAYLESKSLEDLRSHVSDSPFGVVDGFQTFLFLTGHTSRHTAQIAEVKADKNFPKK